MQPKLSKEAHGRIVSFIKGKVEESGASGVAINLSGGIDSALTLKLCVEALGPSRVHALILPEGKDGGTDADDASGLALSLGVQVHKYSIGEIVNQFASLGGISDRRVLGNIKARTRMVLVYSLANAEHLLVAGTSNKSEFLTGYFTKYGDGASDFCPIGDLYKTQLRELAVHVGLPSVFITKTPTAGLWPGQTDEGEMGMTYTELDTILYSLETGKSPHEIPAATGLPADKVEKVVDMIHSSSHKRKLPSIPKIGIRTVGIDWNV